MEDSAVVFEEFRNTAGVMEEEGLLPNVQKEEMEQGETGVKPTGMDIRGEEELEVAGEGLGHKVMTHREKFRIWIQLIKLGWRKNLKHPLVKGINGNGQVFRRTDLGIRYLIWVWCRIMRRHKVWV